MCSFDNQRIIEEVFKKLQNQTPEEYDWLNADPEKRKNLNETVRAIAVEQFELSKVLRGQSTLVGIDHLLPQYLPHSRITLLRQGFDLETFHMNISKRSHGILWVEMTREGEALEPAKAMLESQNIEWAIFKLYGSILVEAFSLVLSLAGVKASLKTYVDKFLNNTARTINTSSKLRKALEEFVLVWNEAGEDVFKKAKALFNLIKDSGVWEAFSAILDGLRSNIDLEDWLITAIKFITIVIAAVETGGVALIAQIALVVSDAKDFAQKIINLNKLRKKKSELH